MCFSADISSTAVLCGGLRYVFVSVHPYSKAVCMKKGCLRWGPEMKAFPLSSKNCLPFHLSTCEDG